MGGRSNLLHLPPGVRRGGWARHKPPRPAWGLAACAGRLTECSASFDAPLSAAIVPLLEAQASAQPCAWVGGLGRDPYPPDLQAVGVDLARLVSVRVPPGKQGRATDLLARSGAFAVIVVDLGGYDLPMPLQTRLLGLAQRHNAALIFLTKKEPEKASLSSLISLRLEFQLTPTGHLSGCCIKDKTGPAQWRVDEPLAPLPGCEHYRVERQR